MPDKRKQRRAQEKARRASLITDLPLNQDQSARASTSQNNEHGKILGTNGFYLFY